MSSGLKGRFVAAGCAVAVLLLSCVAGPAQARDQWSINHGGNNPPIDPRLLPGGSLSGYVPAVSPDFWKGQLGNRVPAGTVLTAILEDDLNSGKNKQGDTFAMSLDDGFSLNGKVLIPPKSKILGSVVRAESAKTLRHGRPGALEVTLQSLVFPDGSHYPIYGFIDGNPNAKAKKPPKVQALGQNIADYGQSLAGMAMSFVSGPGFMMKRLNRGLEFQLDKGDAIPVRLTRSLDIKPAASQPPSVANVVDPYGPVRIPGLVPVGASTGAPPTAPPIVPATAGSDPNAVFHQPVAPHTLNDMPDPF